MTELLEQAIKQLKTLPLNHQDAVASLIFEQLKTIQETLYLQSIPDMVESIKQGGEIPLTECVNESTIRDILNG